MFFKRLEAVGFKSFATRTVCDFRPGTNVIVGPNGCGKSNIMDAIQWVLGEQSAKSLRGKKMQDVIFAGSASFKALGMAHVSVTIDNRTRILPIDYEEVQITRRLMRSGESDYMINKKPCRLRDIQDLFMGTGVGKSSYSVLAQGKVEQIINAKPQDRRFLIEEAAGISKYKARRVEAQRKLERTEVDLSRLNDLLVEIERQVASLKRQASKARRYKEMIEESRRAEEELIVQRTVELRGKARRVKEQLLEVQVKRSHLAAEVARRSAEEETMRDEEELLRERLEDERTDISDLKELLSGCEGQLNTLGARIHSHEGRIKQIETELDELRVKDGEIKLRIEEAEGRRDGSKTDLETNAAEFERLEKQYAELEAMGLERNRLIEDLASELSRLTQTITQLDSDVRMARSVIERQSETRDEAQGVLAQLEEDYLGHAIAVEDLTKQNQELAESVESLRAELETARREHAERQAELGRVMQEVQEVHKKLHQRQSRLETLVELKNSYEGYYQGVREVMQASGQGRLRGLLGPAPSLIHTSEEYELAIEIALATHLQDIVALTAEDGKQALNYLRQNRCGRATILPLDRLEAYGLNQRQREALGRPGVIGVASELVKYDPQIRTAVDFLLGTTIVVKDLDVGLELGRQGYRARYVSLDGQLINPSGAMSGGGVRATGLMSREREMRDLQAEVESLEKRGLELRDSIERLQQELNTAHARAGATQSSLEERQLKFAEMKKDLEAAERARTEAERTLEERRGQIGRIDAEVAEKQAIIDSGEARLGELRQKLAETETRLADERNAAAGQSSQFIELGSRKAEAMANTNQARERIREAEAQITMLAGDRAGAERSLAARQAEGEQLTADIARLKEQMERIKDEVAESLARREELEMKLVQDRDACEELARGLKQRASELEAMRRDEKIVETRFHEVDMRRNELQTNIKNMSRECSEKFEVSLPALIREVGEIDKDPQDLRREVNEYRMKLGRIGAVNMDALEEYEKQQQRFDFLKTQHEDLTAAKAQLEETIAKLDETTRKLFHETFTNVREHFIDMFRRLFNGGKADLFLEADEGADPLLEGGIEILAQPPGKKLQSITLLSGGEKAMTAISLLFALFLHKPAPFCFLDEIDAPLDDANVKRFCAMIREFNINTQFIIITHNKLTMELADTIYGVTMEESGVSKLVSVRFDEAEELVDVQAAG